MLLTSCWVVDGTDSAAAGGGGCGAGPRACLHGGAVPGQHACRRHPGLQPGERFLHAAIHRHCCACAIEVQYPPVCPAVRQMGGVGSVAAPGFLLLGFAIGASFVPYIVFGSLSIFAGLAMPSLPETLEALLPELVQARNIRKPFMLTSAKTGQDTV